MSKFRYFSRFERLEREESPDILPRSPRQHTDDEGENGLQPTVQTGYSSLREAVKERQTGGPKLASRASALREIERQLENYTEKDFADPSTRKDYRSLRNAQLALEASRQKVSIPKKARAFSGPIGSEWPITTSGTAARYSKHTSAAGKPRLSRKSQLLPCVERYARRAALFALGKAGKGWRTPHKRRKHSWIDC